MGKTPSPSAGGSWSYVVAHGVRGGVHIHGDRGEVVVLGIDEGVEDASQSFQFPGASGIMEQGLSGGSWIVLLSDVCVSRWGACRAFPLRGILVSIVPVPDWWRRAIRKPFAVMVPLVLSLIGLVAVICPSAQTAFGHGPSVALPELCPQTGLSRTSFSVDGVELVLCTRFLPAPEFVTPESDNAIQVATAANQGRVFRELSITAIPFGAKPSTEALPRADATSEETYRTSLRGYRERQGGNPQTGPVARLFGTQVVGLVSVVDLHVGRAVVEPVAITEWIVEAGSRIWIVRASQGLSDTEESGGQALSQVDSPGGISLSSPDVSRPSTSLAAMNRLLSQVGGTLDTTSMPQSAASDLPFPPWWDGDCDTENFYAATGVHAYPLGASYRGVKACGPRPWGADGGPEVWVSFFPGALAQIEWQCPELSKRFMYLAYGIAPYSANGSQVVWNCDPDANGCWLEQMPNDGTPGRRPQPGDILSYGSTSTNGHTSVVAESDVGGDGNGTIVVVEQNSSLDGDRTLPVIDWQVLGSAGAVSGWLHDSGNSEVEVPPAEVVIVGPSTGIVQAVYAFTATVSPIAATVPITYVWEAAGRSPVTNIGGLSDIVAFAWNTAGTQAITLTATNVGGTVTATQRISTYVPVRAAFSAAPLAGQPPLTAFFTDTSTGAFTTWSWDFGEGMTSTEQSPTHTYALTGTFSVSLTVKGPGGSDTAVKARYIRVSERPVIANFTAHPASGPAPLAVQFTDASVGEIAAWRWDFGDDVTGTEPCPAHVYTTTGVYTVGLTVSGPGGMDAEMKVGYVAVWEESSVYLPLLLRNYITVLPPRPCVEGIANGGFEDGGDWEIPETPYSAGYTTTVAHSGDRSMRTGIVDPADNIQSWSSARQLVAIPASAVSVTLRLWLYPVSEETSANPAFQTHRSAPSIGTASPSMSDEAQYVFILDENNQWLETLIWQRSNDREWTFHQFDLIGYAGQAIKLQFGVYNDGGDPVTAMYGDDVSLEICGAEAGSERSWAGAGPLDETWGQGAR